MVEPREIRWFQKISQLKYRKGRRKSNSQNFWKKIYQMLPMSNPLFALLSLLFMDMFCCCCCCFSCWSATIACSCAASGLSRRGGGGGTLTDAKSPRGSGERAMALAASLARELAALCGNRNFKIIKPIYKLKKFLIFSKKISRVKFQIWIFFLTAPSLQSHRIACTSLTRKVPPPAGNAHEPHRISMVRNLS